MEVAPTSLSVLIVEDSAVVTERIREVLYNLSGITVIGSAADSREALTIIQLMAPDVVLLDIGIPGISGIQVLKEIKLKYKGTRVIMLTNYSGAEYRDFCFVLGADFFYDKSTEFEKIPETLEIMLAEKKERMK